MTAPMKAESGREAGRPSIKASPDASENPAATDVPEGIFRPALQRRFIYGISLIATLSLCLGFSYSAVRTDVDTTRVLTFALGLTAFAAAAGVLRLTQSIQWSAGILIVGGLGITLVPAYYDGGVDSPYAVWFLVIPLLGGLLLGPRIAYLAGFVGTISMVGLGVFSGVLPAPPGELHTTPMLTMNLVLAITFCTAMGAIVSSLMTKSSMELAVARNTEIEKNLALAEINERFTGSVNVSTDAIVIIGDSNTIQVFNPAAEAMYGIAAEDAVGRRMPELLIPERIRSDHLLGFDRFLETGKPNILGLKLETFSIRSDGNEFPVELTVQEISGTKQKQFIAYIRDLSERNRLQEELEKQGKQLDIKRRLEAIGRLSGGVAHDFNNLLMAINGHTELLLLRDDVSDEARESLREIEHAGDRAKSITRQLLAFSRTDRLETEHVNPARMITGLVDMVKRVLPDSVRLETSLEESTWLVQSEGARLEQAILNMVLNATDAMPDGGLVKLRSRNVVISDETATRIDRLQVGEYGCIEIEDEGKGMDADTLDHVFDPFFTTKAIGEGTGLGLSTAYGIVEQSGGVIDVKSELGVGSTFYVYLPRAEEVEEYYTEAEKTVAAPRGGAETILVVEDESSVRNLVVRTLAKQGYSIIEANDGLRGYDLAIRHAGEIDLIVTDVVMPKLGGPEMVRRLRLSSPELKVIYVSGHSEDELGADDINDARTEFLYKPFNLDVLRTTVHELLEREAENTG